MKYEIVREISGGPQGAQAEPNFTVEIQAGSRQLNVNRKSMPLLAMKYAIGEVFFLRGVWHDCALGHVYALYHSRKPNEVRHEVCDWQNCFLVFRTHALKWWAVSELPQRGRS